MAGGGVINADARRQLVELAEIARRAGDPDADGVGRDPDDHRLMAGMAGCRPPTVRQRHAARVGLRARHRQPVGQPAHRRPRHLPARPHLRPRRHRADPDRARVRPTTASSPTPAPRWPCSSRSRRSARRGRLRDSSAWVDECVKRKRTDAAPHPLRRRPGQAAAGVRGDEPGVRPRHPLRQHDRAVPDRRGPVPARVQAAALDQRRAGRPAGLDAAGRARRLRRRPRRHRWSRCRATTTSSS